jgi:hypothetical protein
LCWCISCCVDVFTFTLLYKGILCFVQSMQFTKKMLQQIALQFNTERVIPINFASSRCYILNFNRTARFPPWFYIVLLATGCLWLYACHKISHNTINAISASLLIFLALYDPLLYKQIYTQSKLQPSIKKKRITIQILHTYIYQCCKQQH